MPDTTPDTPEPRRRLKARTFGWLAERSFRAKQATAQLRAMRFGGYSGYGGHGLGRVLSGSDFDYAAKAGDPADNSAVAACLRVLCDNFPQPLLQVERKDGKGQWQAVEDHPLTRLFDHPNDYYDHYDLWSAVVMSLVVDGNGYVLKVTSGAGIPVQLWWVPSWMIRPYFGGEAGVFIDWYEYQVNGEWLPLDPKSVIHFRLGRPDQYTAGRTHISWLKSGLRSICALNEVDGYTASIMRNGGVPGVIISPTTPATTSAGGVGKFTRDQAEELKENWRHRMTGERRGEALVLTGPFQVTTLGFSPEQMALDKIPARLEDQISSLTGVNAMIALLTSGAQHKTYNNIQESRKSLYEDTIYPIQSRTANKLKFHLLGDPGMGDPDTERVSWNNEGIPCLQEDQKPIWDRSVAAYKEGVAKRSEAREMVGLPFDESDELYVSDVAAANAQAMADTQAEHDAASMEQQPGLQSSGAEEEDPAYDYADGADEPVKSLAIEADRLARSAPAPVDAAEAAVIAKAMETLEQIQSEIGTKARGGGGKPKPGKPKPGGHAGGDNHGHEPGSGGQFAPGGGRIQGHGPKPKATRTQHPAVAEAHGKHKAAKAHLTKLTKAGKHGTPEHREASVGAAKAHEDLHAARGVARREKADARNKSRREARAATAAAKPPKAKPEPKPKAAPKPNAVAARVKATGKESSEVKVKRATDHLHDLEAGKHGDAGHAHIDRVAKGTTKPELFAAADAAGIKHGAKTKKDLVAHLKEHHGKSGAKPPASPGPGGSPKYGPSNARFEPHGEHSKESVEKAASGILGRNATVQDVGTLAGATHDARFRVVSASDKHVEVHVEGPGYKAIREIRKGDDGKPYIHNEEFRADKTGTGLGREVFGRQVEHASGLGVSHIETFAERNDGKGTVGYAVWPKFGYDAPIPSSLHRNPRMPEGAKNVSDLMKTAHGREFWGDFGHGVEMKFDLKAGGKSQAVWGEYQARKSAGG